MTFKRQFSNVISDRYKQSIKFADTYIPLFLFVFTLLICLVIFGIVDGVVIWALLGLPILIISILSLRSGDNKIPLSIGLSQDGIYFEGSCLRKSRNKGFIPWEKVVKIIPLAKGYPDGYKYPNEFLILYRGRDRYPIQLYEFLGYNELVVGRDIVREIERFCKKHNINITIEWSGKYGRI